MRRAIALAVFGVSGLALAASFDVLPRKGEVRYVVEHPFHRVVGVSTEATGSADYDAAVGGKVSIRAPAKSFKSGNGNRDTHMLEVLSAHRHPDVLFQATLPPGLAVPGEAQVEGTVMLGGNPASVKVKVKLTRVDGGIAIDAAFPTSLTAHKLERPSVMFVKVSDVLTAEAKLVLGAR